MATIPLSPFLRRVLAVDAASCLAAGLLCAAGAGLLAGPLGLPRGLLLAAGLAQLLCAAVIGWLASRREAPRGLVLFVIAGNAAWVLGSLVLLVSPFVSPTTLGGVYVVAQATAVAVLAELEWIGLRRAEATAAA